MVRHNVMLFLSVPHTGTNLMREFFKGADMVFLTDMIRFTKGERLEINKVNVIHSHLDRPLMGLIDYFAWEYPTIITVRDPLLAVLSGKARERGKDYSYLIEHFERLVDVDCYHEPTFIPVDLMMKMQPELRAHIFAAKLNYSFLKPSYCENFGKTWSVYNTIGAKGSLFKVAYAQRDVGFIRASMEREWSCLKGAEPHLRPYLESLGYEDLLWWS